MLIDDIHVADGAAQRGEPAFDRAVLKDGYEGVRLEGTTAAHRRRRIGRDAQSRRDHQRNRRTLDSDVPRFANNHGAHVLRVSNIHTRWRCPVGRVSSLNNTSPVDSEQIRDVAAHPGAQRRQLDRQLTKVGFDGHLGRAIRCSSKDEAGGRGQPWNEARSGDPSKHRVRAGREGLSASLRQRSKRVLSILPDTLLGIGCRQLADE
ncbi:MAG: hypothetical protein WEE03_02470 [Chloroflexota bacterium]